MDPEEYYMRLPLLLDMLEAAGFISLGTPSAPSYRWTIHFRPESTSKFGVRHDDMIEADTLEELAISCMKAMLRWYEEGEKNAYERAKELDLAMGWWVACRMRLAEHGIPEPERPALKLIPGLTAPEEEN